MITLSGRYAEALAELGLKPGDRVAAQVEKSVEALMLLGCVAGQLRGEMSYDWRPTPVRVYFHADGTPCKLNAGPQVGSNYRRAGGAQSAPKADLSLHHASAIRTRTRQTGRYELPLLTGRTTITQSREQALQSCVKNRSRNIGFAFGSAISVILFALEKEDGFDLR
jgi:hypothetical protein